MGLILGWLLKFMGSSAFDSIGKWLTSVSNDSATKFVAATGAEKDVVVAQMQTNAAVYHDQAMLAQTRSSLWWMNFLVFLAAIGPVTHFTSVFFVSTIPALHWVVDAVPKAYAEQEFKVIATIVGYSIANNGINIIGKFARK